MWWFYRKGPSGFSGASTAEEVTAGVDGSGLVAVITGASNGIGLETARVLALRGVHVVMPVRNVAAGFAVRESIVAKIPGARIGVLEMDLSSMASVRRFASEFESLNLPLNILINNAGVMTRNCTCSCDGLELHFATNHIGVSSVRTNQPKLFLHHLFLFFYLHIEECPYTVVAFEWNAGHFLLTKLLLENMKRTCRDSGTEGRIVNVTSSGHIMTYPEGICFDKIHDPSGLNDFIAYGQSKLANILHVYELSRIFKEEGVNISANAVHPGVIATNLFRGRSIAAAFLNSIGRIMCRSVEQGAATTCYVAMHPQVQGTSGKYFADCNVASPSLQASDPELAKKLWQFSLKTVSP